jgi:hypothetical protein
VTAGAFGGRASLAHAIAPETCPTLASDFVNPDPLVPVMEVVVVAGEPVWRLCAGDQCVESKSGPGAWLALQRLCRDAGITLAVTGGTGPTVGPPPLPDPGV